MRLIEDPPAVVEGRPVQVFVTGGVVSSLGKGITAASLGRLLASRGLVVRNQKLDPYLNVDPGTMNPLEHGEVFVTEDGAEVDLDFGHYERYVGVDLDRDSSVTAGSVYQAVLARERRGGYLGRTVQVVPHVTDEIIARVMALHRPGVDVVITEVGGTVGDIESLPFLEACRQLRARLGPQRVCLVHVTLVPTLANGEQKSKPTQHSVAELRARGLAPDVIVARVDDELAPSVAAKIADLCGVPANRVIAAPNQPMLYAIPLTLHAGGLDDRVLECLSVAAPPARLDSWAEVVDRLSTPGRPVVPVALVGKYAGADVYLSVIEALGHAAALVGVEASVTVVDPESLVGDRRGHEVPLEELDASLGGARAVVVPGGFGERGFEGKVAALHWARERGVPALGLCLGLQAMVVEAARSLCHLPDANSAEFDPGTPNAVVDLLADQRTITDLGGSMRLGAWPARLGGDSLAAECYGTTSVSERHRHRYEVAPAYRGVLGAAGLFISGTSPDGRLVEVVEFDRSLHPFFLATQAHPELKSRPETGHPLFLGLLRAAALVGPASPPVVTRG